MDLMDGTAIAILGYEANLRIDVRAKDSGAEKEGVF
jgi:hypothetical protein